MRQRLQKLMDGFNRFCLKKFKDNMRTFLNSNNKSDLDKGKKAAIINILSVIAIEQR
jgi:hypothetical protein